MCSGRFKPNSGISGIVNFCESHQPTQRHHLHFCKSEGRGMFQLVDSRYRDLSISTGLITVLPVVSEKFPPWLFLLESCLLLAS